MQSQVAEQVAEDELTLFGRSAVLFFCILAMTLYFTTILVVSTVLPQIQGALATTADEISWIVTFNILAVGIATPTTGWLVARFGRKAVMCFCTAGFAFATLMCGFADSLESLIFWRIVQGAIGAPTVPLTQSILLDTWPRKQHPMVLALNGMGVVLGPIIGPTFAGLIAEVYGWRWAFFMLVPVATIAMVGLVYTLPRDGPTARVRLDWTGFISLSVAVTALQYVLARGQRLDWFQSDEIMIAAFVAVVTFYMFLAHSFTAQQPFLNLSLLKNRNLSVSFILSAIFSMLNFTPMVILPTLLRQHFDYPDALIGLIVGSRGVGGLIGFFLAMFTSRLDARVSMATGFSLLTIAGYWMMYFDFNVTPMELALNGILQGLCIGLIFVPMNMVAFSDLDPKYRPELMSVFNLLRNVSSSMFISISIAGVIRSTSANYSRMVELVNPFNPDFTAPLIAGAWNISTAPGLATISGEITRQSAMIAYLNTFGLFAAVSAVAIPITFLIKPTRRPG